MKVQKGVSNGNVVACAFQNEIITKGIFRKISMHLRADDLRAGLGQNALEKVFSELLRTNAEAQRDKTIIDVVF